MKTTLQLRCELRDRDWQVQAFCFGELHGPQRTAFEAHILACDACWAEVKDLAPAVQVLATDTELAWRLLQRPSARAEGQGFRAYLGADVGYVIAISTLFALLYPLAFVSEIAYEFSRFRAGIVAVVSILVLLGGGASLAAFALDRRLTRGRRTSGLLAASLIHVGAVVAVFAVALLLLPGESLVGASFQTMAAPAGILKTSLYNLLLAVAFVLVPYNAVIALELEMASGRHVEVLALLAGDALAVAPRGAVIPSVAAIGILLLGAAGASAVGVSHLFDALRSGPFMSWFSVVVLVRVVTWMIAAVLSWHWYARSLNEIKRQCRLLEGLARHGRGRGGSET